MDRHPRKRGLSLSISKTKQVKEPQPQFNHHQQQQPTIKIIPKAIDAVTPTIKIQPRNRPASVDNFKQTQPKIIYRMKKTEWEKIRDQNLKKNIIVSAMKNEINFLNKTISNNPNPSIFQKPPQQFLVPQTERLEGKKSSKTLLNLEEEIKLDPPVIKEVPSQESLLSPTKFNVKEFETENITDIFSKTVSFSKKQNLQIGEFTTKKDKHTFSTARQSSRKSIDMSALTQIENRLEQLIEITQN